MRFDAVDAVGVGRGGRDGAGALRESASVRHHVEPDHPYTGRDEQLNDELADEAEPDHARSLTELDFGAPHCVHGDRSDGRERGMFRRDTIGDRDAEVARNPVDLRVEGMVVPCACHQLSNGEFVRVLADFDDDTGERVPERGVRVESGDGALVGRDRPDLARRVEDLTHLVRSGSCLANEPELRLAHLHHLRTGGDEREQRMYQDTTRPALRRRHVEHRKVTGAVVLRHLLHVAILPTPNSVMR